MRSVLARPWRARAWARRACCVARDRRSPFFFGALPRVGQLTLVLVYAVAVLGLNLLVGYGGPDLARARRVLRARRLHRRDPARPNRRARTC